MGLGLNADCFLKYREGGLGEISLGLSMRRGGLALLFWHSEPCHTSGYSTFINETDPLPGLRTAPGSLTGGCSLQSGLTSNDLGQLEVWDKHSQRHRRF